MSVKSKIFKIKVTEYITILEKDKMQQNIVRKIM